MSYALVEDRDRSYQRDEGRNLLIQGDNLKALKTLSARFAGRVKCVYLDPPYNTGEKFTHYKDKADTATWAEEMRKLLTRAHTLLTDDGSVWCSIDDHEVHTLRTVLDAVFGRQNFVATVIWEKRNTRENRACFSNSHDYVLVYAKDPKRFKAVRNKLPASAKLLAAYKNPDNDPRGPWQSVSLRAQKGHARPKQSYTLTTPSGAKLKPLEGTCWVYTEDRFRQMVKEGRIYFGAKEGAVPRLKMFLSEQKQPGLTPHTLWTATEVSTNGEAKKHLVSLFPGQEFPFDHPKPEQLLQRILHIATNPGDLVLDLYGGSGTTAAVAHKMGRRWILVERGEHCDAVIRKRLKKVVRGTDPGGCTQAVGWKGGGGFRFCTIKKTTR